MLSPLLVRLRARTSPLKSTSRATAVTMRRSIGSQKQQSSNKDGGEDIGNHLTGANKFSGKGGRLNAADGIFLVVGLAVVGHVGALAKDEVKEVSWPKIKQKGKEVKEAVKEVGGK